MVESLKGKRRILKVRVIAKASNSAPKTTCRDVEIKNVEYANFFPRIVYFWINAKRPRRI